MSETALPATEADAAPLSVCVYCGSRSGDDPAFAAAARAVGQAIGARGWRLVYGGGRAGLMGEVANAALAVGAHVTGVIPHALMEREHGHHGLPALLVVETMHERKRLMAEHSDAFIALPGGIGTFEELFEAWTWLQLGYHAKPVGVLNVAGYYDTLLDFLEHAVARGFIPQAQRDSLQVSVEPGALLDAIERLARRPQRDENYSEL